MRQYPQLETPAGAMTRNARCITVVALAGAHAAPDPDDAAWEDVPSPAEHGGVRPSAAAGGGSPLKRASALRTSRSSVFADWARAELPAAARLLPLPVAPSASPWLRSCPASFATSAAKTLTTCMSVVSQSLVDRRPSLCLRMKRPTREYPDHFFCLRCAPRASSDEATLVARLGGGR